MINALLYRYKSTDKYTLGVMFIEGEVFYVIERPWLMNARNLSCIPTGEYQVVYLPKSASGKYKKVFHILEVPARSGILEHNGNFVSHSKGCLIIGSKVGLLGGQVAVLNSASAMNRLREVTNCKPHNLTILGGQSC